MAFDFLTRAFSVGSYIGVDIGTTSIKAIELSRSNANPRLTNYGLLETVPVFERPNSVIQANSLRISEKEAGELLKLLVTRTHFSATNAIASIPSFASFTTMIEIPDMSQAETEKAMPFQIKQNIPLPLSEIAVDWVRVGQRDDANGFVKQQVLVIAIPNEIIARFKAAFKIAGLALRALEVGPKPFPTTGKPMQAEGRPPRVWPWILGNALAGQTLGVSCLQWALATSRSAAPVLVIVSTTPILVIPLARVFEGERITVRALLGAVITVGGVAGLILAK